MLYSRFSYVHIKEQRFSKVLSYLKCTVLCLYLNPPDSTDREKGAPGPLMPFFLLKIIYFQTSGFYIWKIYLLDSIKSVTNTMKKNPVPIWYCKNRAIKNILTDTVSPILYSTLLLQEKSGWPQSTLFGCGGEFTHSP